MKYIKLDDVIEILRDCDKRFMPYWVCSMHIKALPSINPEETIFNMINQWDYYWFENTKYIDSDELLQKFNS